MVVRKKRGGPVRPAPCSFHACGDHSPATWLGKLLEDATGYPNGTFGDYAVTGDATNWLAERGIPAAVIELASDDDPEFTQNLAGVLALQCYFALKNIPDNNPANHPDPVVQNLCR